MITSNDLVKGRNIFSINTRRNNRIWEYKILKVVKNYFVCDDIEYLTCTVNLQNIKNFRNHTIHFTNYNYEYYYKNKVDAMKQLIARKIGEL